MMASEVDQRAALKGRCSCQRLGCRKEETWIQEEVLALFKGTSFDFRFHFSEKKEFIWKFKPASSLGRGWEIEWYTLGIGWWRAASSVPSWEPSWAVCDSSRGGLSKDSPVRWGRGIHVEQTLVPDALNAAVLRCGCFYCLTCQQNSKYTFPT